MSLEKSPARNPRAKIPPHDAIVQISTLSRSPAIPRRSLLAIGFPAGKALFQGALLGLRNCGVGAMLEEPAVPLLPKPPKGALTVEQ